MRFGGNIRVGIIGAVLLVLAAFLAPVLASHDPLEQDLTHAFLGPSSGHIFGTDQLGRDIWSRVIYAARTDLVVAAAGALLPAVVGGGLGLFAGYLGGVFKTVLDYVANLVIVLPQYVIVLALVGILGAGIPSILVALLLVDWVNYYRLVSADVGQMRSSDWVRACEDSGLGRIRVVTRHIAPNAVPQFVVFLMSDLVFIILLVVSLSYVGLGIAPPTPEWGSMIADGQAFVLTKWWVVVFPGLAIIVSGLVFTLLGEGISEALNGR
ncbi:MAG: ABC transporter permease [Gordonia sp. (in: high G+C Gram-positive bacteria)]